jgi:hypothetical protein
MNQFGSILCATPALNSICIFSDKMPARAMTIIPVFIAGVMPKASRGCDKWR